MSDTNNVLYLIGSLRNPRVPELARSLREKHPDLEVFDDWFAAGAEADDQWKEYEQARERTYQEALSGHAAKHVFDFDKSHLDRATHVLLVLPAGKSGHMEVMYAAYGAPLKPRTAILLDAGDVRWDVMYQFIGDILNDDSEIDAWITDQKSYGANGRNTGNRVHSVVSPGQRGKAERVSDGGRSARLFPECSGGSFTSIIPSHAAASSWGADALGQIEVDGSPEQDYAPFDGYWSLGRQGIEAFDDGSVEGSCPTARGIGKGRGVSGS